MRSHIRWQQNILEEAVVIVLIELTNASCDDIIMGYKLSYCKTRAEVHSKEPVCVFPRSQKMILISNLQPCTETGDLGHSEAKCFTQSVELIHENPNAIQERGCLNGICGAGLRKCCGASQANKPETSSVQENKGPSTSRGLDLNVASVPDLNEEVVPPREEDNGCTLGPTVVEPDDIARSNGSGESENRIMRCASLFGLLAGSLVSGVQIATLAPKTGDFASLKPRTFGVAVHTPST